THTSTALSPACYTAYVTRRLQPPVAAVCIPTGRSGCVSRARQSGRASRRATSTGGEQGSIDGAGGACPCTEQRHHSKALTERLARRHRVKFRHAAWKLYRAHVFSQASPVHAPASLQSQCIFAQRPDGRLARWARVSVKRRRANGRA